MNYVVINGIAYDCICSKITESWEKLYTENTGRATNGVMQLDPIGTYFYHNVEFFPRTGKEEEYEQLYQFLAIPRKEGIKVSLCDGQTTIEHECYVSKAEREVAIIKNGTKVKWKGFTAKFTPLAPDILPME